MVDNVFSQFVCWTDFSFLDDKIAIFSKSGVPRVSSDDRGARRIYMNDLSINFTLQALRETVSDIENGKANFSDQDRLLIREALNQYPKFNHK